MPRQLFTSGVSLDAPNEWCPIDHFFYASNAYLNGKFVNEKDHITDVGLDCHSGKYYVTVANRRTYTFKRLSEAMRAVADIIEEIEELVGTNA